MNHGQYKLVYFSSDPYLGDQFAIGAIVDTTTEVRFVERKKLPCGPLKEGTHNLLQFVLRSLRNTNDFGRKTPAPTVFFSDPKPLPLNRQCPFNWASQLLKNEDEE